MKTEMRILALICARGGSKRIPRKNVKLLVGKPLIAYTIETAKLCTFIDRVVVSTDDDEIAVVSKKYGAEVPFIRPKELADGKVSRWTVLQHAVKYLGKTENYFPDIVIDLSPTAPLREKEDIEAALGKFIKEGVDVVTTVYKSDKNPYYNMVELENGKARLSKIPQEQITQIQEAPKVYSLNDAINVVKREALLNSDMLLSNKNITISIMPRERSIDIDEVFEFELAEFIIKKNLLKYESK